MSAIGMVTKGIISTDTSDTVYNYQPTLPLDVDVVVNNLEAVVTVPSLQIEAELES